MQIQNLPSPTKFIFWCTSPFFVATIVLIPFLVDPARVNWAFMGAFEAFLILSLIGLYDPVRFTWCWRCVGAMAFAFSSYGLVMSILERKWVGDGSPMPDTVGTALKGFIAFGLPGLVFAVLGRFTWNPPPKESEAEIKD